MMIERFNLYILNAQSTGTLGWTAGIHENDSSSSQRFLGTLIYQNPYISSLIAFSLIIAIVIIWRNLSAILSWVSGRDEDD